jgi:hypothetical protein
MKPLVLILCTLPAMIHAQEPTLPDFEASHFAHQTPNPYFPLQPTSRHRLDGTSVSDDGATLPFHRIRTVTGPGPVILGVQTTALLDEEFENGRIIERSVDFHATDDAGNVWYFGEDVTEFTYDRDGTLKETRPGKSWQAGRNDARPGIVISSATMPAAPVFMAHAAGEDEMEYNIGAGNALTVAVPAGTFGDVIRILTQSTTDPDLREYTWWARDVGLIRVQEDLSPALDAPKVEVALVD